MGCRLVWRFLLFWYTRALKNKFSWDVGESAIALNAFCESQKIFIGVFPILAVFLAASQASKIVHNYASSISFIFPKNIPFIFPLISLFAFQQRAIVAWPWSSFDLSVHRTNLVRSFLAFLITPFLLLIMTSALSNQLDSIFSTGSIPLTDLTCWSMRLSFIYVDDNPSLYHLRIIYKQLRHLTRPSYSDYWSIRSMA